MACGEKYTIAVSQDGTTVYACGFRGSGQFGRDNWTPKDVFVPVVSVYYIINARCASMACCLDSCWITLLHLDRLRTCLQEHPSVPC